MRIVSLLPSTTEILFDIGAGDDVVGVTFECDHPAEARARRIVSTSAMPEGLSPTEIDAYVADAMRLGADGLLSEDGLHRTALSGASPGETLYRPVESPITSSPVASAAPVSVVPPVDTDADAHDEEAAGNEPILTADELRALLAEQPTSFSDDEGD